MDNNQEQHLEEINEIKEAIESSSQAEESEEIANLKSQIELLQDKLFRTHAEMENTRKRLEKARDEARDYGITSLAKDLLIVSDNLSRALSHKPISLEGEVANIIAGVEMIKDELNKIFQKHHIEVIEPTAGQPFDYNLHNAISQVENAEYTPNSVVSLMQVGYKIKDRLLRPATVQVSKPPEKKEP